MPLSTFFSTFFSALTGSDPEITVPSQKNAALAEEIEDLRWQREDLRWQLENSETHHKRVIDAKTAENAQLQSQVQKLQLRNKRDLDAQSELWNKIMGFVSHVKVLKRQLTEQQRTYESSSAKARDTIRALEGQLRYEKERTMWTAQSQHSLYKAQCEKYNLRNEINDLRGENDGLEAINGCLVDALDETTAKYTAVNDEAHTLRADIVEMMKQTQRLTDINESLAKRNNSLLESNRTLEEVIAACKGGIKFQNQRIDELKRQLFASEDRNAWLKDEKRRLHNDNFMLEVTLDQTVRKLEKAHGKHEKAMHGEIDALKQVDALKSRLKEMQASKQKVTEEPCEGLDKENSWQVEDRVQEDDQGTLVEDLTKVDEPADVEPPVATETDDVVGVADVCNESEAAAIKERAHDAAAEVISPIDLYEIDSDIDSDSEYDSDASEAGWDTMY